MRNANSDRRCQSFVILAEVISLPVIFAIHQMDVRQENAYDTEQKRDGKEGRIRCIKGIYNQVAAAAATTVILFACGFLFGSFQIVNGFEVVKDGLLLIGAIGLFLVAGMLLAKGKKKMQMRKRSKEWMETAFQRSWSKDSCSDDKCCIFAACVCGRLDFT